jgi:hypothetical protein
MTFTGVATMLRRFGALGLAVVLGSATAVAAAAPATAGVTLQTGLVALHSSVLHQQDGTIELFENSAHLQGPLELGGALFSVDLTTGYFSCLGNVPGQTPVCGAHTVPLRGSAQLHPTASVPVAPQRTVSGSCQLPYTGSTAVYWVPCDIQLDAGPSRHVMFRMQQTTDWTVSYNDSCFLTEDPFCMSDPIPDIGGDFTGVYSEQ